VIEIRLRTKTNPDEMDQKIGKILTPSDINVFLTGAARVYKPNGQPLCVYVPGGMPEALRATAYPILHTIQGDSKNRGAASGAQRVRVRKINYARPVKSNILGAFDPSSGGRFPYCRLTAWTGRHTEHFMELYPYFQEMGRMFAELVPARYAVQKARTDATHPDWVIPGTPFTTVTVNNTYPTGVHKDAGDLAEGFSCLTVLRRGDYSGGALCFPEYRVGVDMQDGDAIFMDAHEWHGNLDMELRSLDAERISVVLYYRTQMTVCASMPEEIEKAKQIKGGIDFNPDDDVPEMVTYDRNA
jgi:hypothetical protein